MTCVAWAHQRGWILQRLRISHRHSSNVAAPPTTPPGPYFCDRFSAIDLLFAPFLERMSASLFYFKGFVLRDPSKRRAAPAASVSHGQMVGRTTRVVGPMVRVVGRTARVDVVFSSMSHDRTSIDHFLRGHVHVSHLT